MASLKPPLPRGRALSWLFAPGRLTSLGRQVFDPLSPACLSACWLLLPRRPRTPSLATRDVGSRHRGGGGVLV